MTFWSTMDMGLRIDLSGTVREDDADVRKDLESGEIVIRHEVLRARSKLKQSSQQTPWIWRSDEIRAQSSAWIACMAFLRGGRWRRTPLMARDFGIAVDFGHSLVRDDNVVDVLSPSVRNGLPDFPSRGRFGEDFLLHRVVQVLACKGATKHHHHVLNDSHVGGHRFRDAQRNSTDFYASLCDIGE